MFRWPLHDMVAFNRILLFVDRSLRRINDGEMRHTARIGVSDKRHLAFVQIENSFFGRAAARVVCLAGSAFNVEG